jgi:hypothetical protein
MQRRYSQDKELFDNRSPPFRGKQKDVNVQYLSVYHYVFEQLACPLSNKKACNAGFFIEALISDYFRILANCSLTLATD